MRARLAVVCLALVAGAGCDRGDNPAIDVATTTTSAASDRVTSTTAAPSPTVPSAPASTPERAADGLFERWQAADRPGASRFARPRAIDELFAHPNTGDVRYERQGCEPQGGQFLCSWTYPGGALQMTVEDVPGGGYVVDLVSYIAD